MTASEIIIVSGLPRSGTSLMMQMLEQGGVPVVTDQIRTPDADNPRGYYEFEAAKKIKHDASWLPAMRGHAFKLVSQLLLDLPASENYRVLFMERNLDEVLASQETMLERLGRPAGPRHEMKRAFTLHLAKVHEWLRQQSNVTRLVVNFNNLIEHPESETERVCGFLGGRPNALTMAATVDPTLYRNRNAPEA